MNGAERPPSARRLPGPRTELDARANEVRDESGRIVSR